MNFDITPIEVVENNLLEHVNKLIYFKNIANSNFYLVENILELPNGEYVITCRYKVKQGKAFQYSARVGKYECCLCIKEISFEDMRETIIKLVKELSRKRLREEYINGYILEHLVED